MLKRKILIKNKRLNLEVEKQELELFKQGQFVIEDEVKEDASAPPSVAAVVEPVKVNLIYHPKVKKRERGSVARSLTPPLPSPPLVLSESSVCSGRNGDTFSFSGGQFY